MNVEGQKKQFAAVLLLAREVNRRMKSFRSTANSLCADKIVRQMIYYFEAPEGVKLQVAYYNVQNC